MARGLSTGWASVVIRVVYLEKPHRPIEVSAGLEGQKQTGQTQIHDSFFHVALIICILDLCKQNGDYHRRRGCGQCQTIRVSNLRSSGSSINSPFLLALSQPTMSFYAPIPTSPCLSQPLKLWFFSS